MDRRCGFSAEALAVGRCVQRCTSAGSSISTVLAEHLLAVVAEQTFHLAVDEQHLAIAVDDDHAVGHGLDHFEQPVIFFHRGTTVVHPHTRRLVGAMLSRGARCAHRPIVASTRSASTSGSGQFGSPPLAPPPPSCAAAGRVVAQRGAGQSRQRGEGGRPHRGSNRPAAAHRRGGADRPASGWVRPSQPSAWSTTARRSSGRRSPRCSSATEGAGRPDQTRPPADRPAAQPLSVVVESGRESGRCHPACRRLKDSPDATPSPVVDRDRTRPGVGAGRLPVRRATIGHVPRGRSRAADGLRGTVAPGGVDWQSVRADGAMEIRAHYLLRTDQDEPIEVESHGLRVALTRRRRAARRW